MSRLRDNDDPEPAPRAARPAFPDIARIDLHHLPRMIP